MIRVLNPFEAYSGGFNPVGSVVLWVTSILDISLSNSIVAEDAPIGTVIGILSVTGGSGVYVFTKTADPDNKFSVVGSQLRLANSLDHETATFHLVTIKADNGVSTPIFHQFRITVTNVPEGGGVLNFSFGDNSALLPTVVF